MLRIALRTFGRNAGFTTVVVLILGIGIGANTAMFTLVNGILLTPLPSPEGHRILHLGTGNQTGVAGVSWPDFVDWRSQDRSFSGLALIEHVTFNVSDGVTAAEPVTGARLTANAFRTLRVAPLLGRDFQDGEDRPGAAPVVVLGHGLWMRRYGGDPGVIGRTIRVADAPAIVIGIMPEGMKFPAAAEMWMPLVETAELRSRDARRFEAFGRLRDGVSIEEARAGMELVGRRLEAQYPESNRDVRPVITPYTQRAVQGQMRVVLMALQGAAAFLLLVVCANAANLLLSRSAGRRREIAIRIAVGAGRLALVRQLLLESLTYAALGGALGLALASGGVRAFDLASSGTGRPYWLRFGMDYRVFGVLALLILVTGILFGLAPALELMRAGVSDRLKERAHRLASAFVVAQLALTLVLLVGFGLLARSIINIYGRAKGFETASVLTMRLRMPSTRFQDQETLLTGLRRLPGVESAAVASHLPAGGSDPVAVEREGLGETVPAAALTVSPEYFRTFGIRLVAGRQFSDADGGPGHANVIVNQRFAAKFGVLPGKRVRINGDWMTVAGISADVRQNQAGARELAPVVYLPSRLAPRRAFLVALRTSVPPERLSNSVRNEIHRIDPDLPVSSLMSMAEVVRQAHWPHRVFGSMFAIIGLVAAGLAGLGVYSVMAYSVTARTQEIGLRMALGASRADIAGMVVARGLRQVALGLLIGVAGALVVTRGLRALLVEVSATDPVTFAAVGAFLAGLGLFACWLPARRAAGIGPMEALRQP